MICEYTEALYKKNSRRSRPNVVQDIDSVPIEEQYDMTLGQDFESAERSSQISGSPNPCLDMAPTGLNAMEPRKGHPLKTSVQESFDKSSELPDGALNNFLGSENNSDLLVGTDFSMHSEQENSVWDFSENFSNCYSNSEIKTRSMENPYADRIAHDVDRACTG